MEYRTLGRSGLKVSPICLGTMMFGGATDEADSARIVASAREAGVNFIDTADVYNVRRFRGDHRARHLGGSARLGSRDQGREPDG